MAKMRLDPIQPSRRITRRGFLGCAAAGVLVPANGWSQDLSGILRRIQAPRFPDRDFNVQRYGAAGDGKTNCREAFAKAIAECHFAGGGRVTVPAGTYLSNGPIRLASNVNLHVAEGATIRFGTNPADYLPAVLVRWESTQCYNYSPLIYALQQENIAVTGTGTLDGQAQTFWGEWKAKQTPDQEALREMAAKGVPVEKRVFGDGHFLRPSLCEFHDCRNVLIEGVTMKRSPFWTMHPVFCTNVTVRGVRVQPGTTNDDGCDPDSCRDVLIEDCEFDTADDNISIKAGRDRDGWGGRPCENIIVRRCRGIRSDANAYTIGSEISGGVRNIYILDSSSGTAKSILYVKSNSDRGGTVENLWVRGIQADFCDICIQLQTDYKGVTGHPYPTQYRNFHFEDIQCRKARRAGINSIGVAAKPIEEVYLKNITIASAGPGLQIADTRKVEIQNVRINGNLVSLPDEPDQR
jgi:polygalacturonase